MIDYSAEHHHEHREPRQGGWALALTIAALLLLTIFQAVGVARDHHALAAARAAQQPAVDQGMKLRSQLQTLADKTAELANAGDKPARDVLDLMRREGVTITPAKAANGQ